MVSIRLPDGSSRAYDNPVTVADVAASIGPGLAKAAVAGRERAAIMRGSQARSSAG